MEKKSTAEGCTTETAKTEGLQGVGVDLSLGAAEVLRKPIRSQRPGLLHITPEPDIGL